MESAQSARISPLALAIAGGIGFAYLAFLGSMLIGHRWIADAAGHPLASDFLSFWSAGHLALGGHAAWAYDWPRMHEFQTQLMGRDPGGFFGWAYPPLLFLAAAPLAAKAYLTSFLLWTGATLALYLAVAGRIACYRAVAMLALAAPATLACVMVGQNGFLTAALIGAALLQLEARPWLAGLLLGLLTYKPHFGLLIPVALIFGGYGRAFLAAAITTLAILALSFAFAPDSLATFIHHIGGMAGMFLSQGQAGFYKQQSLYGLLRMLGAGDGAAFIAQGALLLAMIGFTAWLWRSKHALPLKCAGLCAATLLATPYLYLYDFPILAIGIAFLWRARAFDRTEVMLLILSQLAIAAFMVVNAPLGLLASLLVLTVILRRLPLVRTAPRLQPAQALARATPAMSPPDRAWRICGLGRPGSGDDARKPARDNPTAPATAAAHGWRKANPRPASPR